MITQARFAAASRLLHWLMAPMVVTMLSSGSAWPPRSPMVWAMVSIHRPLGFAILVLCLARIVDRFIDTAASCRTVPSLQRFAARAWHVSLYALMLIMPLVGWGMLSAARYPIVLYGPIRLPPILPR